MSALRMTVFLVVVLGLTAALHYYFWDRLVRAPGWPAPWGSIATWVIVGLALSVPLAFLAQRFLPRAAATPIAWVAFVWMGGVFLLFVLLLPTELVRLAHALTSGAETLSAPERRQFLSRAIAATVAASASGLGAAAMVYALRPVAVERVLIRLPRLSEALRGFRIVQLTDVHVGPTIGRDFIEQLVEKTNALAPDVIAITGDLVDGTVEDLREHVAPLAALRARHGVFFVTGNHEYYSGADAWIAHLSSLGITVLKNEHVRLEHEGAGIDLAGVHDHESGPFGHGSDLEAALRGRDASRPLVLLAHQPKAIVDASARGVDLQISGHTHGGQIFPFNYLVRLQQPYVAGLHRHGETALYVSKGTGYWGPPMRLAIPAEITEIVLHPADVGA